MVNVKRVVLSLLFKSCYRIWRLQFLIRWQSRTGFFSDGEEVTINNGSFFRKKKENLGVLGAKFGYPIDWQDWQYFVNPEKMTDFKEKENNDATFAIHLWNHMGKDKYHIKQYLDQEKNVPLTKLFQDHCPIYFAHVKAQNSPPVLSYKKW